MLLLPLVLSYHILWILIGYCISRVVLRAIDTECALPGGRRSFRRPFNASL